MQQKNQTLHVKLCPDLRAGGLPPMFLLCDQKGVPVVSDEDAEKFLQVTIRRSAHLSQVAMNESVIRSYGRLLCARECRLTYLQEKGACQIMISVRPNDRQYVRTGLFVGSVFTVPRSEIAEQLAIERQIVEQGLDAMAA